MSQHLEGLNLVKLLDQLRPMTPPPEISMMPQTIGWLVLFVTFFTLTILGLYALRRHRNQNAYRRAALLELEELPNDPAQLANLLRRTALTAYDRNTVAALQGDDWLRFLDNSYGGSGFQSAEGQKLISAPYRPTSDVSPEFKELAAQWIRKHRWQAC